MNTIQALQYQREMKQTTTDLLQKAYRDLPEQIENKPAYAIKDGFGDVCAVELIKHVLIAKGSLYAVPGHGNVVTILRDVVDQEADLGQREILVYVDALQKFYRIAPNNVLENYIKLNLTPVPCYVVEFKFFDEFEVHELAKMQEELF